MNLADVVASNAAFGPDRVALRFDGGSLTYAALTESIEQAASALSNAYGVGHGDRVAHLALNGPDTLVLLYACARLGAIFVPLNWRLAAPELVYILAHAEPKLLVVGSDFAEVASEIRASLPGLPQLAGEPSLAALRLSADEARPHAPDPARPLLLVYTSGTTGRPKGAVLTHGALAWNATLSQHMHGLTADDHVLTVLPFFHVGGLNIQTTPALQVGARVTIHPRFDAGATLAAIAAERPTLTVLVPATMSACIAHPAWATTDLSSLRAVTTGSTFVPQPLVEAFEARGVPVLQVYGATETGPVAIYTRHVGERRRPGSTGWPGPFCEARVVDADQREVAPGNAGEVELRGPQVFAGYWRDQAATAEALQEGWFRTGDIATRDPDGAFTIHDRKKNVIISGGENIYPAEIERVLLEHPAVAEAAVVGRPDSRWGETPVAFVVPRPGMELGGDELAGHVAGQLARFKLPREYVLVQSLPKSALGKVQHHLLRAAIGANPSSIRGVEGQIGTCGSEESRGLRILASRASE